MEQSTQAHKVRENTINACITRLRKEVERSHGKPARTRKDFEALSEAVFRRTGTLLSATTLMRLWGYVNERVNPRGGTLTALARFVGCRDWHDFTDRDEEWAQRQSGTVLSERIDVDKDLRRGDLVRLSWRPGRICDARYLGDRKFRIERTVATSLPTGATFSCALIISGEPLYLDRVRVEGSGPVAYVCGKRDGVRFEFPEME